MKRIFALTLLALIALQAPAQNMDDVEIEVANVSQNVYVLFGQGGNIGVLTGDDGVVLIDDQFAALTEKIVNAVKTISDKEIRFVINTHWHGDHVGGNENLANLGASILAHENVRMRMSTDQVQERRGRTVPASPYAALPVITFDKSMKVHLNGQEATILHGGSAHTDGDAVIYFNEANVIHTGDLFVTYGYPYVDKDAGGSFLGLIALSDLILETINEKTKVIPGHGPISSKEDVKQFRDSLAEMRDIISAGIKAGKSANDLIDEDVLSKFNPTWGGSWIKASDFIQMVYPELTE